MGALGWILGLLFMLGVLFLFLMGVMWLLRQTGRSRAVFTPPAATPYTSQVPRVCPTCGRPMAADWTVCPYDGTILNQRPKV